MVTEYKVIKPFGSLNVGDILVKDGNMYKFSNERTDNEGYYSQVNVAMSENVIAEYEKSNLVEAIVKEETLSESEDKLERIAKLVRQLKYIYNKRKNNIEKRFSDGKIQPCVKVEHDTVYFNLTKLLNKIDDIIKN